MIRTRMRRLILAGTVLTGLAVAHVARAHCEIPCGIYGDRMRVAMLKEHFETVEKSMREIRKLQLEDAKDVNQLSRWIANKEEHANKIQHIVYQYFMTQRIKPAEKDDGESWKSYVCRVTLLHKLLVSAMKCKQTTDRSHVKELRSILSAFEKSYFENAESKEE